MTRQSPWNSDYVYRVTIRHLYADGLGCYLERSYGPYTTKSVAKSQMTRLLRTARQEHKKAEGYIEESWVEWEVSP